jgi:hypothetical protein
VSPASPLRIGFDMDGVLADMNAGVDRIAQALFDEVNFGNRGSLPDQPTDDPQGSENGDTGGTGLAADTDLGADVARTHLSARQQRQLSRRINATENFWDSLDELEPGSVARLAALASARRWDIIFLTKRPTTAGDTSQVQTQRWLQRHGFPLPSVFVVNGSRGLIAKALSLDFVIDDRPQGCLDVVLESKARAILVWREKEADVPAKARRLGIAVVPTVAACLDMLVSVDELHQKPGMLTRIKRLLGIEREASIGA